VATLAPGLTLWDAGEFIAAVHTFGIPHQPGTPLYVTLARAWSLLLPFVDTALATNLFSAACTAAAGGALAVLLARVTGSRAMALAGALCAGGMFTVWSSATETEVYASVLLLVMLMLIAAERAGRTGQARWRIATAYALALAVPLHLSALVAAPAAVLLVTERENGEMDWLAGARLAAVLLIAAGIGLASVSVAASGGFALAAVVLATVRWRAKAAANHASTNGSAETLATLGCALLAISALAVLVVRARFDPWLNEGAPANLRALWEVIGRRQFGARGMWPREAPVWAQVANWFEYADWQVALGLSNDVAPSFWRTPVTIVFAALGIFGSARHRELHARSWRALLLLFVCASAGLIVYLNFKAGASFGWGVLPDSAPHEVRDRDYFFVLGFWVWGAWAGIGAVALANRLGAHWIPIGVLAAALPLVLNARAANRRTFPERAIALAVAHDLLQSAPPNAVLVTGGDNDTFPAWYAQAVEGMRPDVTVVVAPLLATEWYRAELARRSSLVSRGDVTANRSVIVLLAGVARAARAQRRPITASLMTDASLRAPLGDLSVARGIVLVDPSIAPGAIRLGGDAPSVDTSRNVMQALSTFPAGAYDSGVDPGPETLLAYLRCPSQYLALARRQTVSITLDSACKLR
jgi:transmembrane protein TMEM260 (protein O-mannosyltransferase)